MILFTVFLAWDQIFVLSNKNTILWIEARAFIFVDL